MTLFKLLARWDGEEILLEVLDGNSIAIAETGMGEHIQDFREVHQASAIHLHDRATGNHVSVPTDFSELELVVTRMDGTVIDPKDAYQVWKLEQGVIA